MDSGGLPDLGELLGMASRARERSAQELKEEHDYNMSILMAGFQGEDTDALVVQVLGDLFQNYTERLEHLGFTQGGDRTVSGLVAEAHAKFSEAAIDALNSLRAVSVARCAALGIELPKHPSQARAEAEREQEMGDMGSVHGFPIPPGRAG